MGETGATRTFTAPEHALRLDTLVDSALQLSRNQAATLIAEGRVTVNGRREKASYKAAAGESIAAERLARGDARLAGAVEPADY